MGQRTAISLTSEEAQTLRQWARAGTGEYRMVERAKVILLANQGKSNLEIAEHLKTRTARVSKWRQRFGQRRLDGLQDAERSGRPAHYDKATEKRVLTMLDEAPPKGYGKWSGALLADGLGDVSDDQVWRVLRKHDVCLQRRRSWCISTDPEFGPKAADIVGLYLNPPENALVLCVDEKPSIQALERAQVVASSAQWQSAERTESRLQAARHHDVVCGLRHRYRTSDCGPLPPPAAERVFGFHEPDRSRLPGPRPACRAGQPEYPQAERRPLAKAPSESPFAFHPDLFLVVEPGGMLVQHTRPAGSPGSEFHVANTTARGHRQVRQSLQPEGRAI